MTMKPGQRRRSGAAADEIAAEANEDLDKVEDENPLPEVQSRLWRGPGFQRLRFEWRHEDQVVLSQARAHVEGKLGRLFPDVYNTMYDIYNVVRDHEVADDGHIKVDQFGDPVWKRHPSGLGYVEDWARLSQKQLEHFLFLIATHLFDWRARAEDLRAEALFARGAYTEQFASSFDAPATGTEGDRRAAGELGAAEERYFALYQGWLSRRADALIKTMEGLEQRIKDILTLKYSGRLG